MSVDSYHLPHSVKVVSVIQVIATRGGRGPSDPPRVVHCFYSFEGELLACYDPILGSPDQQNAMARSPKATLDE